MNDFSRKSTVDEIRERFDRDVERFSNLETGQSSAVDSPLCLELITDAAKAVNPAARQLLDIGCGAGNYTIKMLSKVRDMDCTLVDLSKPMLAKAKERVVQETSGKVETIQSDVRDLTLTERQYDIVLAASVLHHLRDDREWETVFEKIYRDLKKGGSFWVFDLIVHDEKGLDRLFRDRYGNYLEKLGGADYKEHVFEYIEKEDTPRSLTYQLDLMRQVGFSRPEILHKNECFAAFGGIK